ncbi:hypothetical protein Y1Q_0021935 [Alligator mississippiensis]|uniref:Lysine-specific metallo-endopeptidase domain-containing protein n=2 Tax=Alligator mississippiensis TaxID=8496 RepID=A0A151NDS8_ALLMI|nr:hypothetical protein Y1Q_0021935 [Alligator mississippiensis]
MQVKRCVCFCRAALETCSGPKRVDSVHTEMSSREAIVCGKEENQRKCHISKSNRKSHVPLTKDEVRIAEAARQSALEILRDAVKKKDRVLMETPQDLISCDSEQPQFWMERYAVVTEKRVRDLISVLEEAKFMGDPSREKTYAYVYTETGDKTIYLCPLFWKSPSHLSKECQPGTLIHEASHFLGARDITYDPDRISVAYKGQIVKNSLTDPDKRIFLPLVTAVLNANSIAYEFEVTLRHRGDYKQRRYSCCGETARSSVCESAVPDEFFTSLNNGRRLTPSTGEVLAERLVPARDRLQRHVAALRRLADAVDEVPRRAMTPTSAGGAVGTMAWITGFFLAPFTAGRTASAVSSPASAPTTAPGAVQCPRRREEMRQVLSECQAELTLIRECLDLLTGTDPPASADSAMLRLLTEVLRTRAGRRQAASDMEEVLSKQLLHIKSVATLAGSTADAVRALARKLDIGSAGKDSTLLHRGAEAGLAATIRMKVILLEVLFAHIDRVHKALAGEK